MFFIEALVIGACLQGSGCRESTSAYYSYNKDLQAAKVRVEKYGKVIVKNNQWLVYSASPAWAMASGQTAHIKLYRQWVLNLNVKDQMVGLQWTY